MPRIMGLDGHNPGLLDDIRSKLYGRLPRPFFKARVALDGPVEAVKGHLWATFLGVALGFWLAGSTKGREVAKSIPGIGLLSKKR